MNTTKKLTLAFAMIVCTGSMAFAGPKGGPAGRPSHTPSRSGGAGTGGLTSVSSFDGPTLTVIHADSVGGSETTRGAQGQILNVAGPFTIVTATGGPVEVDALPTSAVSLQNEIAVTRPNGAQVPIAALPPAFIQTNALLRSVFPAPSHITIRTTNTKF